MNPNQPHPVEAKLSGPAQRLMERIEFDANEKLICEVRKHPFGMFIIIFGGIALAFATLIATSVVSGYLSNNAGLLGAGAGSLLSPIVMIVGIVFAGLIGLGTLVGMYIYENDVMLVTSEKLAQMIYKSIFNRNISQLSIGDVQDVNVNQKGIFAHLFNYGTIVIETAGEQQNYNFTFARHPYKCGKDIVNAHETNLSLHGN